VSNAGFRKGGEKELALAFMILSSKFVVEKCSFTLIDACTEY
jgi:hypothetical protein